MMKGKKGLIMGVANDRSIAWGIAKKISSEGGKIAFTYQGEVLKKRVQPLIESIDSSILIPCDVTNSSSMVNTFEVLKKNYIAFDNFDEAKNHINKHWEELSIWWNNENVQFARKIYLSNFFNVKANWYKEWSDYIYFSKQL